MGRLVEGKWVVEEVNPKTKDGEFHRQVQKFHDFVGEEAKYPAVSGRYHLYIAHACPWAHRILIMRELKDLCEHIDVSVVSPWMLQEGWEFTKNHHGVTGDQLYGLSFLRELYVKADPVFSGRVTVPVLWDKESKTIVNNESAELVRIFNSGFNELTGNREDYYPENLQSDIDEWNEKIYHSINNGVYKTGFARTQEAYEKNFDALFRQLDEIEEHLEGRTFLAGETLTEADIRFFTTLIRFDAVYYSHFKCNLRRIADYPNLSRYAARIYQMPKIQKTVNFDHIKTHYYGSHETLNPSRIVPKGPSLDYIKNPITIS